MAYTRLAGPASAQDMSVVGSTRQPLPVTWALVIATQWQLQVPKKPLAECLANQSCSCRSTGHRRSETLVWRFLRAPGSGSISASPMISDADECLNSKRQPSQSNKPSSASTADAGLQRTGRPRLTPRSRRRPTRSRTRITGTICAIGSCGVTKRASSRRTLRANTVGTGTPICRQSRALKCGGQRCPTSSTGLAWG